MRLRRRPYRLPPHRPLSGLVAALLGLTACGDGGYDDAALETVPPGRPLSVAVLPLDLAERHWSAADEAAGLTGALAPAAPDIGSVSITRGHGRQTAVSIDIALVFDPALAARLSQMSARDWFDRRQDLMTGEPNALTVVSWELAPNETVAETSIDRREPLAAGFVFIRFNGSDYAAGPLTGSGQLTIQLLADDFLTDYIQ